MLTSRVCLLSSILAGYLAGLLVCYFFFVSFSLRLVCSASQQALANSPPQPQNKKGLSSAVFDLYSVLMAKEHVPTSETRKFVREATRARINQDKICRHLGITEPTLRKHYRAELDGGSIDVPQLAINKVYEFLSIQAEGRYAQALQREQAKVALDALKSHGFHQGIDINVNKELPRIVTEVVPESDDDN